MRAILSHTAFSLSMLILRFFWNHGRRIDCGEGVCPENAKPGLIDMLLECSIWKSYGFTGFGIAPKIFQGIIQPQNVVRMYGVQLDALFRMKTLQRNPGDLSGWPLDSFFALMVEAG